MKAFHFRLAPILKLKEQLEQKQLLIYALSLQKNYEAKKNYEMVSQKFFDAQQNFKNELLSTSLSGIDFKQRVDNVEYLKLACHHEKIALDFASQEADKARNSFIECKKKREILEKLKKKQKNIYVQGVLYREEKMIEDVIQSRRQLS